jgi:succinate dehydrogenase/fumarate reductase flavoprotein subunit
MLDITREPIEIAPTAHYSMGEVRVRPGDHGTGINGLYETGEAASGLYGAKDIAGFQDLAHAFDLKSAALAARATIETAFERRETRGCYNRSDYSDLDPRALGPARRGPTPRAEQAF